MNEPTNDRERALRIIADEIRKGDYMMEPGDLPGVRKAGEILAALESAGLPIGGPGVTLTELDSEAVQHLKNEIAERSSSVIPIARLDAIRLILLIDRLRVTGGGAGDGPVDEAWLRSVGFAEDKRGDLAFGPAKWW